MNLETADGRPFEKGKPGTHNSLRLIRRDFFDG